MVGEWRNGNLLVQLGPRRQVFPEELLRQRRTQDGQTEYLVRWALVTLDEGPGSGGGAVESGADGDSGAAAAGSSSSSSSTAGDGKNENVLMWMSTEDLYANCPSLLGKRKSDGQRASQLSPRGERRRQQHQDREDQDAGRQPAGVTFDQVELCDMKDDVKNLVRRARRQMAKTGDFSISITHTIHVLRAYAGIGALAGVFKETGALDLLMELLCNRESQTRRSAGKMLRALASHDAGSRAYVLLSLSQQDGIEQHMDFDNRYTLLELFAETTSSEEHGISFEGIHLPQIPGKHLFSLVKRYLCVTSLMDKLNTAGVESNSDRHEQFDFSMAMANLIAELVRVMGWDRVRPTPGDCSGSGAQGGDGSDEQGEEPPRPVLRSIFQPRFTSVAVSGPAPSAKPATGAASAAACLDNSTPLKGRRSFKTRLNFSSRLAYVEYVQANLTCGMLVRMLEDYDEVSSGDEGVFRYSNDGSPPVQVYWNSLSRTYWVHWHMVEILAEGTSGSAEKESQEVSSALTETLKLTAVRQAFLSKPPGGLYSLPYMSEEPLVEDQACLSRTEWWEVLFFIKKLEPKQQTEANKIIRQSLDVQSDEDEAVQSDLDEATLVNLTPPGAVAKKLLHFLNLNLSGSCLPDLLCSNTFSKLCLRRGDLDDDEEVLESELPSEDDTRPSEDLDQKMKVFDSARFQGKKSSLEIMGEVASFLRTAGSDPEQQIAGMRFITRTLEEDSSQKKTTLKSDSTQSIRERVLSLLMELLEAPSKDVVVSALRLTRLLMLKYDWRVSFATEGGVHAVLSSMHQFPDATQVQQTLKVITGASKHDLLCVSSSLPLSESGTQIMLEIFSSIGSAAPEGSSSLLAAILSAIDLMLQTKGCMLSVRNGLLVIIMLISNHKQLAEQLLACGLIPVLKRCHGAPQVETLLALIALHHIFMVHKLESKDLKEDLGFKDTELEMIAVSLKNLSPTRELILSLEQLLSDEVSSLEERSLLTRNRDTYQVLVRLLDQFRPDRDVQLSILRILTKFLDDHQEDILPWHESIEPCLSSITAFINEREVVQQFIHFLFRLASLNKDYAVVMCRVGTKEVLAKALDKHGANLQMVPELRDLVGDCEKYASLYKKMTTSILAGCIQMVLGQIEEHRRSHQPINIPFFDVFLKNLCQGSSVELKEDKCWEKVVVSSNHHRANKLTDKNPKTYWESNGCTGSHFINIFIHKGVLIRQLAVQVASEDSSYMPARILVLGGDDPNNITAELNTVNVPPSARRVVLLENMTRFWSIIQIRIKRCQQGGIDARLHGFEVLGPKPTFWPVFKDQLCCRTFLFYSTKAQTWCQDVLHDRGQLLQLFNRLNSALKHEQLFADRFLPDVEAAQALGGTCWEALIIPIVNSIAHPALPLGPLPPEYLLNARSARRHHKGKAAIFNSRVRRLTHLLVHVDSSRVEEIKPPVKSKAFNRSKDLKNGKEGKNKDTGVVEQQVKVFLESSCGLVDFVERYRSLYLHLKHAMEELFGQQTPFALALRKGFSAALLQLSVLRAMHVSERFAQYIDQMIQESGGPCGCAESLERLQQFLEPMLFLSGLEMASTFEHFYRYYLGDRLLSRGNVWLESLVMEHIGICFPNRFPEQMLKNLAESTELRKEFHLYRLQQLDHELQSQALLDQPKSRQPRRLQWTWLGHAELTFNSWTLHVSTLQMFILLHFNQEEELSVEALHQVTGLPPSVLAYSLAPLTADGGLLLCSTPGDLTQGVLRMNPNAKASASEGGGASCRLLPKQDYLSVDEDAADALERKRNYIYCTIISIMKREKEIHIDNLVFKVLDKCQKQGGVAMLPFSCSTSDVLSCIMHVIGQGYLRRHDDSPHIVEYVAEDPATPKKGQAQFSFFRGQLRAGGASSHHGNPLSVGCLLSASHPAEDGGLEAVLNSMGRTMTQDEVLTLMQRTVQMVSGTLDLDEDWAEHLLIFSKWNVDVLVQSYTDDPDALMLAAGLKTRNPDPAPSPVSSCPVCLSPRPLDSLAPPTLSCLHYCCQKYLIARMDQNMVMSCTCPITDCRSQPTSHFFFSIFTDKDTVAKYEQARLRGFAHYPASCSHMSQWMDDGGYYEGMTMEAQSKHLAKLISKRCPSCQAQIEKDEGCLHMTCVKCNHGFCWRCLKSWKPTHKDYYNCSAMVSKAARQEKKFQDYNEGCTFHNQAKDFAVNLENRVSSINEVLQMKSLTFVIDSCKVLAQARKVLAYSCVYSYYNQETEKMDVMEQQTEALDFHTNGLQILLEETVLQCPDLALCIRLLKPEHLNTGLELNRRIQERLVAILHHSTQDFRVGYQSKTGQEPESSQASNLTNYTDTNKMSKSDSGDSDNINYPGEEGADEDEDYVPQWHEDYDEGNLDEDDFFSDDDSSDNLDRDLSPFD
ncbi:hypothetical protein NHX12_022581 [Muraenolepis orangiensis]|uniref:Cullin-9 n=1 Tax=Muraenolepis orangiensis TaxID=630683 RepID=A0A9Q0ENH3_9TELE|nr:hypothetical protein NHX12_022581 [Muraenolepis orangiensis]